MGRAVTGRAVRAGKGGAGQGLARRLRWLSLQNLQMWICKPTASNQGSALFCSWNQEEVTTLQAKTQSIEDDPIHQDAIPGAPRRGSCRGFAHGPHEGR